MQRNLKHKKSTAKFLVMHSFQ